MVALGYFGYLLARGWFHRSVIAISLALLAIALYGGALLNLLPGNPVVSWEMHLFGFLAGVLAAWLFGRPGK